MNKHCKNVEIESVILNGPKTFLSCSLLGISSLDPYKLISTKMTEWVNITNSSKEN